MPEELARPVDVLELVQEQLDAAADVAVTAVIDGAWRTLHVERVQPRLRVLVLDLNGRKPRLMPESVREIWARPPRGRKHRRVWTREASP